MKYLIFLYLPLLFLACGGDDNNGPGSNNTLPDWTIYAHSQDRVCNPNAQPPRELPPVKWETDLGGYSKSSPVLFNGKVYSSARRELFEMNSNNGDLQWTTEFEDDINSKLCIFDNQLFAGDDSWYFAAIDPETGNQNWRVRLNGDVRGAPCFTNGIIYVNDDFGAVYALNSSDGSLIWSIDLDVFGGGMALANDRLYFLSGRGIAGGPSQSILAVDIADGSIVWQTGVNGATFNTPAVSGNTLVMGTDGFVYGLNATTGDILWETTFPNQIEFVGSPAIADGKIYIGSQSSAPTVEPARLAKLDLASGSVEWTRTVNANRFGLSGAPLIASGVVVAIGDQAGLLAWDADSGDLLWNFTPNPGFAGSTPIISQDQLFFLDVGGSFYRLGN